MNFKFKKIEKKCPRYVQYSISFYYWQTNYIMNSLIENLSNGELLQLRNMIDEKLSQTKTTYYVVYNSCYGGFNVTKKIVNFYNFLYPDNKEKWNKWDLGLNVCRWNPVFVLTCAALEKCKSDDGDDCDKYTGSTNLKIDKVEISPNQHIEISEYDGMESVIISEGIENQRIPDRPINLRKKLEEFAKENNIKINEKKLNELPTTGPYSSVDN